MSVVASSGVSNYASASAQLALRTVALTGVGGSGVSAKPFGLSLDFTSATISDTLAARGFTFTRLGATATRVNSSGVLETVAANTLRIDHNPTTLACLGGLFEEVSTNAIRNSTMVGAAAGSPGTLPTNWTFSTQSGVTASVVATGTENGIAWIECRFVGTSSAAGDLRVQFEGHIQVAASSGQAWTESAYLALANGSVPSGRTFNISITERDSGGSIILSNQSTNIATSLTSTLRRFSFSVASTNASTAFVHPYFVCFIGVGAVVDFTIRIGAPQLEQKAFATSYIPTSTAALTRNLDALTLSDLTRIGYSASAGTLVAQGVINGQSASVYPALATLGMGASATDEILLYRNGASSQFMLGSKVTNVTQFSVSNTTTVAVGTAYKTATAWAVNDAAQTTSGAAPATDTSGSLSTIIDRMSIGGYQARGGGTSGVQTISRIEYYPRRLSNAELQSITT